MEARAAEAAFDGAQVVEIAALERAGREVAFFRRDRRHVAEREAASR